MKFLDAYKCLVRLRGVVKCDPSRKGSRICVNITMLLSSLSFIHGECITFFFVRPLGVSCKGPLFRCRPPWTGACVYKGIFRDRFAKAYLGSDLQMICSGSDFDEGILINVVVVPVLCCRA